MVKLNRRCSLAILTLYLFVLILIYKCIPQSSNGDLHGRKNSGNIPEIDVTVDPYRLNWDNRGKVFYKKVRTGERRGKTGRTGYVEEKAPSCDRGRSNNGQFTRIQTGFFIFSSYFDNRTGAPEIRSIGIFKSNSSFNDNTLFMCHFQIRNSGKYPTYATSHAKFYEMCENHERRYGGYIISCPLPDNIEWLPNSIRIGSGNSTQENFYNSKAVCITSRDINVTRRKLNFGVCVPPLHGFIRPNDLIEFVELHRLLGADIFTFYLGTLNYTVSNEVMKVLKHYQTKNIVNLVKWKLPIERKNIWYHGQSLAINDCLYRNMADFQYVAFIDIDEVLVPNGPEMTSWFDLVKHLKATESFESYSGFTFRSAFFDDTFSKAVLTSEMRTSIRTNRTHSFSVFRNKLLVRPSRVFEIGIHHVSKSWPENAEYSVLKVEPEVARIHHYRACVREFGIQCKSRVNDDVVPRKFGQHLIDNFYKTMYDILP